MWDSYAGSFSSLITAVNVNTVMANTLWDNMYVGINAANLLIENAQAYLPDGAQKDRYLGEAYFMRAFNYQKLVRQYGGVPLKVSASTSVEREFSRNSAEEVMAQVIRSEEHTSELQSRE